jgi:hypothetical protein
MVGIMWLLSSGTVASTIRWTATSGFVVPVVASSCWRYLSDPVVNPYEVARDHLGKRHEPGLRVGSHGEATLEAASTISCADPGSEDEGVTAVESDSWLDEN